MSSIATCDNDTAMTCWSLALAVLAAIAGGSVAAAQEPAAPAPPSRHGPAVVGQFKLDADYPRSKDEARGRLNFSLIRQDIPLPEDVVYFIFDPEPDVLTIAEQAETSVRVTLSPCRAMSDRPAWGYQALGGTLERVDANPDLHRYVGRQIKPGAVFVPVLRNLRLYEPVGNRVAYEWLERAVAERQLCVSYMAVGFYQGSRAVREVGLSDHAQFEYR